MHADKTNMLHTSRIPSVHPLNFNINQPQTTHWLVQWLFTQKSFLGGQICPHIPKEESPFMHRRFSYSFLTHTGFTVWNHSLKMGRISFVKIFCDWRNYNLSVSHLSGTLWQSENCWEDKAAVNFHTSKTFHMASCSDSCWGKKTFDLPSIGFPSLLLIQWLLQGGHYTSQHLPHNNMWIVQSPELPVSLSMRETWPSL